MRILSFNILAFVRLFCVFVTTVIFTRDNFELCVLAEDILDTYSLCFILHLCDVLWKTNLYFVCIWVDSDVFFKISSVWGFFIFLMC